MASLSPNRRCAYAAKCSAFILIHHMGSLFNSNFQWSTTSRDVKDGDPGHITREPEQVKAFRDTWRDGIHSYLTYLRDRLSVARDLLAQSGSIFIQIGDQNVHRVRALLDEVFGEDNFIVTIPFAKKGNQKGRLLESVSDNILWASKSKEHLKFRNLFRRSADTDILNRDFTLVFSTTSGILTLSQFAEKQGIKDPMDAEEVLRRFPHARLYTSDNLTVGGYRANQSQLFEFQGVKRDPGLKKNRCWMHTSQPTNGAKYCGMDRLAFADRIVETGNISIRRRVVHSDAGITKLSNLWSDTTGATNPQYVVETNAEVVKRCLLMSTDPGDLVLDPTCGSGTTAFVAEQWGRRWVTVDSSRVALALARARVMGARYPYYLLSDSSDGRIKESEITGGVPRTQASSGNIRLGFVYERVAYINSTIVANDARIDVIWDKWQKELVPLREKLNASLKKAWRDWDIPRGPDSTWSDPVTDLHSKWWKARIARQKEIDESISANAEFEYLYDRPYSDSRRVRVAGPFTVESLSPHRVLGVDEHDELIDPNRIRDAEATPYLEPKQGFPQMILENLRNAGVQQAHKEDKIVFSSLTPWPGDFVCGEGRYREGSGDTGPERRAAIFIGPEFGTVTRPDLVAAAKEAGDSDFDVLISCAFNYEAHATEFNKLGRIPVLKARMNADLHMSEDLKNTGKGNLFVVFGEPDITVLPESDGRVKVKVNGVDVFDPSSGEVRSDGADGIACWFIDTDYNEESFFVRHAYFLGANDPYGALKTTLRAEINEDAWATLHSDTSRAFVKPKHGRIAVKVINHLGDEVMKVFKIV